MEVRSCDQHSHDFSCIPSCLTPLSTNVLVHTFKGPAEKSTPSYAHIMDVLMLDFAFVYPLFMNTFINAAYIYPKQFTQLLDFDGKRY